MSEPKLLIILFILVLISFAFLMGSGMTHPKEIIDFLRDTWDLKKALTP